MDRRHAMARDQLLPDRTRGAALFADIAGFTPLTEALERTLGALRGAEELTRHLDRVYDALISEIDCFGGSVIGFSGDGITSWFDGDNGRRATACALRLQRAMAQSGALSLSSGGLVTLSLKAAVAGGPVRRFVVGDPAIQVIDVMAGETLGRMAAAEKLAHRGEVLLSPECRPALGDDALIFEWRGDGGHGAESLYPVVGGLMTPVEESPWPRLAGGFFSEEQLRPWLLQPIFERLRTGHSAFLAELRPAVALFMRFAGIDYDGDEEAGTKLDAFIRWVQGVVAHYEGAVIQITFGDKGSYLCATFGAPTAHGDDPARAVAASLELRRLPAMLDFIRDVQIGISRGRMCVGPCGGRTRRTYMVMGDDTNLAARLMQSARPGQIIVSQRIADATRHAFDFTALPPMTVKGKSVPINVLLLEGPRVRQNIRLDEPSSALPMVGREAELALVQDRLERAIAGQGQIIGICGDAGIGKSRLVGEVVRLATGRGLAAYGGACQSYGTNIPYLVWSSIWQALFGLDPGHTPEEQVQQVAEELVRIDPGLVPRLPLLAIPLRLSIPDNDLTRSLDARTRKASLEALLVDCLKARAQEMPALLVLEDCHWLDPLSFDLLQAIGPAIADRPVLLVLVYRTPERDGGPLARLLQLPHCTMITLCDFSQAEAARLIELRLQQFGGDGQRGLPEALVERISARAQGNPFYIEELLNYLRDRGLDPRDARALEMLELPDSLRSLLLSRIDQLSEGQKITLKVASIIGRLFPVPWLWGVLPRLGTDEWVKANLEALSRLDLTPLDTPEPDLRYIFKNILTQEVVYESQPYAARTELHGNLGGFIEEKYAESVDKYLDLLAYHYGRSSYVEKQREYYRRAGQAAQAAYAPEVAIGYYQKALALGKPGAGGIEAAHRFEVYDGLGKMLMYQARYAEGIDTYAAMRRDAEAAADAPAQARGWYGLAAVQSSQGDHRAAIESAARAEAVAQAAGVKTELAAALEMKGRSLFRLGDVEGARALAEQMLALTTEIGARREMSRSLNLLGAVHNIAGRYEQAERSWAGALQIAQELGDRWQTMTVMNNLGVIAEARGDYRTAAERYQGALKIAREAGHRDGELMFLTNVGSADIGLGEYGVAEAVLRQVIEMGGTAGAGGLSQAYQFLYAYQYLAEAHLGQGKFADALAAARQALALAKLHGAQENIGAAWRVLGMIAAHLPEPITVDDQTGPYDARACLAESLRVCTEAGMEGERARTLRAWAQYELEHGDRERGAAMWQEAREVFARLGAAHEVERMGELPARAGL